MKKSKILVVALSLALALNTVAYAVTGLEVATSYGVLGDSSVSSLPQELSVINCPAGNTNTSGKAYNLQPNVVGVANWKQYMLVAIQNYNVNFSNAEHSNQYNYKTYINVYDMTSSEPFSESVACYDITDLAGKEARDLMSYINGIQIDDENLYVCAANLKAPPYVHIYENPVKGDIPSETLTRKSLLQLMDTGTSVVFRNKYADYTRPVKLKLISNNEKNYLIVNYKAVDIARNSEFPAISIIDVTDAANPAVVNNISLSEIKTDEVSISRYYDMDFDGTYGYIVGANMGTIDNANKTISDAYYALFKLDFSDPMNVTVAQAWKLCEIKYNWLVGALSGASCDIETDLYIVPALEINDGVVVTSFYRTKSDGYSYKAYLNGLTQAYIVKEGSLTVTECVPSGFTLNSIVHNFGANLIYINGVYYVSLGNINNGTMRSNVYACRTEAELLDTSKSFKEELREIGVEQFGQTGYSMHTVNTVRGNMLYSFYQYYSRSDIVVVCTDLSRPRTLEETTAITSGQTYYATVSVNNTSADTVTGVPITALYDATGLLIDCYVGNSISVNANETDEAELPVTVPSSDDYSGFVLKTFLFDDLSTITPLCSSMPLPNLTPAE